MGNSYENKRRSIKMGEKDRKKAKEPRLRRQSNRTRYVKVVPRDQWFRLDLDEVQW